MCENNNIIIRITNHLLISYNYSPFSKCVEYLKIVRYFTLKILCIIIHTFQVITNNLIRLYDAGVIRILTLKFKDFLRC